jgi:hypothetical protein
MGQIKSKPLKEVLASIMKEFEVIAGKTKLQREQEALSEEMELVLPEEHAPNPARVEHFEKDIRKYF